MQLERIPPSLSPRRVLGTPTPYPGVDIGKIALGVRALWLAKRRVTNWKAWMLLAVLCVMMLGAGRRVALDYRFESPSAALLTYWEALAVNDSGLLSECLAGPTLAMPQLGHVWFLPPTQKLGLYALEWETIDQGHVLVSYQVRYWAQEGVAEEFFDIVTEMIRVNGEWHILPPEGQTRWPDWAPVQRLFKS